jgi:hypothetical protein
MYCWISSAEMPVCSILPSMLRSAIDTGRGDLAGDEVPSDIIGASSTSVKVVWDEKSMLSFIGKEVGAISFMNVLTDDACGEQDTEWFGEE